MDHAAPPAPPPHHVAPGRRAAPPFARGDSPAWTLTESAEGLVLVLGAAPPVRFGRGAWRATPLGRTLTAVGAGGTMRLRLEHAPCRDGGGQDGGGQRAALLWNGHVLSGCLLETGDRPYPGG